MAQKFPAVFLAAALPFVLLGAPAAKADSLEDYYRTQFMMRVCNTQVEATDEQRENLDLSVEEEVMDVNASSEDIAAIFTTLQAEYDANRWRFCRTSEPVAEEVLNEMGN